MSAEDEAPQKTEEVRVVCLSSRVYAHLFLLSGVELTSAAFRCVSPPSPFFLLPIFVFILHP